MKPLTHSAPEQEPQLLGSVAAPKQEPKLRGSILRLMGTPVLDSPRESDAETSATVSERQAQCFARRLARRAQTGSALLDPPVLANVEEAEARIKRFVDETKRQREGEDAEEPPSKKCTVEENEDDESEEQPSELLRLLADRDGRLPDALEVPRFTEEAHGTPREWNNLCKPLYWSRRVKKMPCFAPVNGASLKESLSRVREFLKMRLGPDGFPILDKLGTSTEGSGWFRFPWLAYDNAGGEAGLPLTSNGQHGKGYSDWKRAWHGCKFEALYSIMFHGRLFSSCDAERGDRFFGRAPGVYVHKDDTCKKTANYFRFVPLCQDGVFWAALWEVMVDRADRVAVSNTDQWVQREGSVRLAALWLVGCQYDNMHPGMEVSDAWDPLLEAHPHSDQFRVQQSVGVV